MARSRSSLLLLGLALALVVPGAASAATITVNTTDDPGFRDIPKCAGQPGDCSLRDAANKANENEDDDLIVVPAGTYNLQFGEISLYRQATVRGAGARATIVNGGGDARYVFTLNSPDNVELPLITVTDLTATGGAEAGIHSFTSATLERVTLRGNNGSGFRAPFPSEVAFPSTPSFRIVDSAISGNTAQFGGGAFVETGPLTVVNSTITGNTATGDDDLDARGGGIYFNRESGALDLFNVTIAGNSAEGGAGMGGNIFVTDPLLSEPGRLKNTIVANGTAAIGPNCDGDLDSEGHNLISDGQCGFDSSQGDLNADPQLEALANNGGPTDTLALSPGSPAIDSGSDCDDDTDAPLAADQRGVGRPQGPECDIGAYETAPPRSITGGPSNVTYHSATISGDAANPDLFDGNTYFQWGKTTDYGQTTQSFTVPPQTGPGAGGGAETQSVFRTSAFDGTKSPNTTVDLDGLEPLTTYHYRLVTTNQDGTAFGEDRQFTTTKAPDPDPQPEPEPEPEPEPQPEPNPRKPRLRVSSLAARCYRNGVNARVRVSVASGVRLRRLTITLDGREIVRTTRKQVVLRLNVRRLRGRSHVMVVRAVDSRGRSAAVRRDFSRCAQRHIGPRFTG